MKVKHILGVILLLVIAAGVVIFGASSGDEHKRPEYSHSINGGSRHRLKEPAFAISDNHGRVFIADSGNHQVAVFNNRGKFLNEIGGPKSEKPLSYPYGIGLIGRNRVLVADIQAGALIEYDRKGQFKATWHSGQNFSPAGIFVAPDNKVYVTDVAGKQILVFSSERKVIKTIKSAEVGLDAPQGIWVNDDDTLWVADSGNYNVKLLDLNGKLKNLFDGGPDSPLSMAKGLAVDKENRIYVTDTLSNLVRVFDSQGNNLLSFGLGKNAGKEFRFPVGVSVDDEGRIYIADQGNNQVQVWIWE